jgi:hypothetical protein
MKMWEIYLSKIQEQEPAETTTSTLMAVAKSNGMKKTNELKRREYQECGQAVGEQRKACRDRYKQQSFNVMARAIQDQMRNCSSTKNPGECNKRMGDQVKSFLDKARAIRV